jgi:hypothetical protein
VTKVTQGIGGKGYSRNWWQRLLRSDKGCSEVTKVAQK